MALRINGEFVDDSAIRLETSRLREEYAGEIAGDPLEIEMQLREEAKRNVVVRTLLRQSAFQDPEPVAPHMIDAALAHAQSQSAVKTGCDPRADEAELRREMEGRIRVSRLIEKFRVQAGKPRHKEVVEFYRKNRDRFFYPEMIRASHIVKNIDETTTEKTALEALREIQPKITRENFAEMANEHSDCRGNGGDLGYFPRGQMVSEFEAVVFAMEPGDISTIFHSPFGFHIAYVVDRRPEGIRPLSEVESDIESALIEQKVQRALDQHIERLLATAQVDTVRQKVQA